MAKILTDTEMADIVHRAIHDPVLIDCTDAYRHFLEGLGDLIADHFGGERGGVSEPDGELGWTCAFRHSDSLPDETVYDRYDGNGEL